jgi:hypothetical protein
LRSTYGATRRIGSEQLHPRLRDHPPPSDRATASTRSPKRCQISRTYRPMLIPDLMIAFRKRTVTAFSPFNRAVDHTFGHDLTWFRSIS